MLTDQVKNTQVLVHFLAWKKSLAKSGVWVVQNNLCIAET